VHEVSLSAAAFTNFGLDHLDYHKTREIYFDAKLILFKEILKDDGAAVVLGDQTEVYEGVSRYCKNVITFGFDAGNFIRAENVRESQGGMVFDLEIGRHMTKDVSVGLFGKFQILNVLCAISLAHACGLPAVRIVEALGNIRTLEGRMERIGSYNGGQIYVDYAHTADGFGRVLETFRRACAGRLICVFGCGGGRDKSKRCLMGSAASEMADVVVITDDNPRSENPSAIRREILNSCPMGVEIEDRKEAIKYAVGSIEPGDFVIILGKGHETTQIYGTNVIPHNDKDEVLSIWGRNASWRVEMMFSGTVAKGA
jgi:UDP-N-acetylmuramoyl-L-alanyl-D-glutamate--2,6-diaminopimelate ligase